MTSNQTPETPGGGAGVGRLRPVPHDRVRLDAGFWGDRQRINRERTLPTMEAQLKRLGRFDAADSGWRPGRPEPEFLWTGDLAEWIEVAALSLATHPDAALEEKIDHVAELIALCQQPDGYLHHRMTEDDPEHRWRDLRDSHRLYVAGHFFEAAVAHFAATGKRCLLDVARRYADHIGRVFGRGEGQIRGYDGHEEVELALVKLYRATGEERHLRLAEYFIEERGQSPNFFEQEPGPHHFDEHFRIHTGGWSPEYNQSHAPVREQTEVVGHAVRAMYLYCAIADLARETGDVTLLDAGRRLWENLSARRLFVTGGLGSSYRNEGMTEDYDLPNAANYCETCAACGLAFWNHRLLQADLDGRYGDLLERTLFNAVAVGVTLDGTRFTYWNKLHTLNHQLETPWHDHHQPWFGVACCPPNVARLTAQVAGFFYSQSAPETSGEIAVHLYGPGEARAEAAGVGVTLRQETGYPWDGNVALSVEPERPVAFTLRLRLPGWCRGVSVLLNGAVVDPPVRRGYAALDRVWQPGDVVRLQMPLPVERLYAHPRVRSDVGRAALQRGPLVYCFEEVDNGPNLDALSLAPGDVDALFEPGLLGGVVALCARAFRAEDDDWEGALYRREPPRETPADVLAVPYAVWDERAVGEMAVWLRETRSPDNGDLKIETRTAIENENKTP